MNALLLLAVTSVGYIIAYHTYGRFLARKIFKLDPHAPVPSKTFADGQEYIESDKQVLFGHHFTSIAGTGPIVGPAIGVIWGWLPAILWVFLGSILMGAVHDFSALVISMRNQGQSIAEISEKYINRRVRTLFFCVVFLALLIVIAIFGLVIAIIFAQFPQAVFPVWAQIPIAMLLGVAVFKRGGNLIPLTGVAVVVMIGSVVWGAMMPVTIATVGGIPPTGVWTIILLAYAYIASVLPVNVLLQPRDYINAWQLYIALGLVILGIVITSVTIGLPISTPAVDLNPVGAPNIWPFLFITIACGAISGFHCLISSGTTSKQIKNETDAQFIGYGAMITEAFLATIIIIAVTAGISIAYKAPSGEILTGLSAWNAHYGSWTASSGLGSKLTAVVVGCANMMKSVGISLPIGTAIMGVFIASFAGTTLDSATRVQRYIISEFFSKTRFKRLSNKWLATGLAVSTAAILAFSSGANGTGALALWPMFGAVNQLLGGLALLVATAYLRQKGGLKWLMTALPCGFLMGITLWASWLNQVQFSQEGKLFLMSINGLIMILAIVIAIEAGVVLMRGARRKGSDKIIETVKINNNQTC
jgi:carbon starvation protein